MGGMIKIVGNTGGQKNASPEIRNLRTDGIITPTSFTIKYIAEDFENTILRHYIYIDGEKKEITKDVGYENINNEFTYEINELSIGTKYKIRIEVTDGIYSASSNVLEVSTAESIIYGVKVLENNSNPESCVTYIENATNMTAATKNSLGNWSNKYPFNKIRIVGFKNGQVVKEINKDNKTQYIDGSPVETDVDVMVEIPKIYWKFTNISNGYELRISNHKIDSSYNCYAHKVGEVEKDFIYIGAYLASTQNGKLRSRSNIKPTTTQTLQVFRQQAQANGPGYQQMNWFTLLLLQILYLIAYKNLDSQNALGMGYTNSSSMTTTGGTDKKGFCYGSIDDKIQMYFLGIEDLYGNLRQFCDGIIINNSYQVLLVPDNKNFNDNADNYKNINNFISINISGKISKVAHTNEAGFLPKQTTGSVYTYYCDSGAFNVNCIGYFGGRWHEKTSAVIFGINMRLSKTTSASDIGSRLCYLG